MVKWNRLTLQGVFASVVSVVTGAMVLFPLSTGAEMPWKCVANCGSGPPSGPGQSPPSGPTPRQQQQQQERAMHDANEEGADAYARGDWANAIRFFEQALEQNPDDPSILQNLANAKARQAAEAARVHSQTAVTKPLDDKTIGRDGGSLDARRVFDTPGERAPTPGDVVDTRGSGRRIQIPASLANHPEIKKLQTKRNGLENQLRKVESQLESIRQKKASGEGNRGDLDVQEAKAKQQISNVTNQIGMVDDQTKSFVINLTREATPAEGRQQPR